MIDAYRVYRLTATRAHETINAEGLNPAWFEDVSTITTIQSTNANPGNQIKFKIEKHLRKTPNQGEITITNLSEATREEFVGGPMRIRLEAGYDDDFGLLFLADLRYASNELVGTEWLTKLQLGDGARAFANARINKTYAKGTPLTMIVGDLARSFGVPVPAISNDLKTRIATGEVLIGSTSDELTRILDPFGIGWSFQNGRLQILPTGTALENSARVITTPENGGGMIGAPAIHAPKIIAPPRTSGRGRAGSGSREPRVPKLKVKHRLYPELSPGQKVQVTSRSVNGLFRIESLTHEGELFGDDWTTEIEATATS